MKKHLIKILVLIVLVILPKIGLTNSYLSDTETSSKNMVAAGCWSVGVPKLISPVTDSVVNSNTNFDWEDSWVCSGRSVSYEFEAFSDSTLMNRVFYYGSLTISSLSIPDIADGTFFWHVRAKDNFGSTSSWSTAWKLVVDRTAPDTIIDTTAFTFHSTEANSTFMCKLDSGSYESCTSPKSYSGLSDGAHTFFVYAIDQAGNSDLSPAQYTWTVSSTPTTGAGDVVINEVMWMGSTVSDADEWIELRNTTSHSIDISNWRLENVSTGHGHVEIPAGNSIPAGGFFLIANYDASDSRSALKVQNDLKKNLTLYDDYSTNGAIVLKDSSLNPIDSTPTPSSSSWPAGVNSGVTNKSMERNTDPATGWHPCTDSGCTSTSFWDVSGTNYGTPKAANLFDNEPPTVVAVPSINLTLADDKKSVSFKVENLSGFVAISYELTYDSDQAPQGVTGKSDLNGATQYTKDNILLGTCSTGGTCTYNTGVKNIHLKVDLTDKDGKVTTLEKSI